MPATPSASAYIEMTVTIPNVRPTHFELESPTAETFAMRRETPTGETAASSSVTRRHDRPMVVSAAKVSACVASV